MLLHTMNLYFSIITQQIIMTIKPLFVMVFLFTQPIHLTLLAVGGCIILDTLMARIRVHVNKRKNNNKIKNGLSLTKEEKENASWTSRRMRMGLVPKMLTYQSIIVVLFFIDFAILNQFLNLFFNFDFFITKLGAMILISIEALSIDESFKKIVGKSLSVFFFDLIKNAKTVRKTFEEINPAKKDEDQEGKM